MRNGPAVLHITAGTVSVSAGGTGDSPSPALMDAALDWIDEPIGLLGERPIAVAEIWRSLMVTMLGPRCESVVVVHPRDWPRTRIERVAAAANTVSDHIEAVSRDLWSVGPNAAPVSTAAGADPPHAPPATRRRPPRPALIAALAAAVLAGLTVSPGLGHPIRSPVSDSAANHSTATHLVEGRMAVQIPPGWLVHRVTSGPGSRRLQATSPDDPALAIHLTWSYLPEVTLAQAGALLEQAIAGEPPGVFADFRPQVTVAGRAAVSYRENRPGRVISWTVLVAGSTRIAIGCQSPAGHENDVRAACLDVVGSAHEA